MNEGQFDKAFVFFKAEDAQGEWPNCSPLITAVRNSRTELGGLQNDDEKDASVLVEALLETGFDCDVVDEDSTPALSIAVGSNALWAVESLMRHGANPNIEDRDGMTALNHAAGSTTLARLLLSDKNANVNKEDNKGCSFLDYAFEESKITNDDGVLKMVLGYRERRQDVLLWALGKLHENDTKKVLGLLFSSHRFIDSSHIKVMERAVLRRLNNSPDWSPEGLKSILQMLLDHGAAMCISTSFHDWSRLVELAIKHEYESTLELLLDTNPEFVDKDEAHMALGLAVAAYGHDLEKVKIMLRRGAKCDTTYHWEHVPLHSAVKGMLDGLTGDAPKAEVDTLIELLDLLIEHGANPKAKDSSGKTAWDIAQNVSGVPGWDGVLKRLDIQDDSDQGDQEAKHA